MGAIKGSGKDNLIACRVNDDCLEKIDNMLSRDKPPYGNRADFLVALITEYFERDRVERIQKETILEFIKNDPEIKHAIRERAIEILTTDLAEAKKE